jgi:hypothetical protein
MKMILPAVRHRRTIDKLLQSFFDGYREPEFRRAISAISRTYHLPRPRVVWFEYLDWGKSGGRTYEDGKIHLVHPENWKRGRKYNTERRWINTVYHEMGHYIFWSDAERKADTFAYRMVRGINGNGHPNGNGHENGIRPRAARGGDSRASRRRRRTSAP